MTTSNRWMRGAVPLSPHSLLASSPPSPSPAGPSHLPGILSRALQPGSLSMSLSLLPPSSQGSLSSGTGVCDGDGSCYQGWPVHQAGTPSGAGGRVLRPLLRGSGEPLTSPPSTPSLDWDSPPSGLRAPLARPRERRGEELFLRLRPEGPHPRGAWPGPSGLRAQGLAPPPARAPPQPGPAPPRPAPPRSPRGPAPAALGGLPASGSCRILRQGSGSGFAAPASRAGQGLGGGPPPPRSP